MRETLTAFGAIAVLWAMVAPSTESREPFVQRFADSCPDGKCPLRERAAERIADRRATNAVVVDTRPVVAPSIDGIVYRDPEPAPIVSYSPPVVMSSVQTPYYSGHVVASSCGGVSYSAAPIVVSSSCSGRVVSGGQVYQHVYPRDSPVYERTYTYQGPVRRLFGCWRCR